MGITGLFETKYKNASGEQVKLSSVGFEVALQSLKGRRVCIDTSYFIYNSMLAMKAINTLTDKEGNPTSHISVIMYKAMAFQEAGIDQIWIFDNPEHNKYKQKAREIRSAKKKKASDEKHSFTMTAQHVNDIKDLLTYLGIMYIEAPKDVEAEQYGAKLTIGNEQERFCDYMISADTDVLIFGGNMLVPPKKATAGGVKNMKFTGYSIASVLEALDIDREQLAKMAVALGCDFAAKVVGVGPAKVVDRVKAESINFTEEQLEIVQYFLADIEVGGGDLIAPAPDPIKLVEFLKLKGFNVDKFKKRLFAAFELKSDI